MKIRSARDEGQQLPRGLRGELQGSRFLVRLPADARRAAELPGPAAPAERGERLLLSIDDDPSVGSLVGKMLAGTGWRVASVTEAAAAVDEGRRLHPDAITLDLLMPGRDGLQIMHDLRSDSATRDIPVIVVTILDAGASVAGAQAHLAKPIRREVLLEALDRVTRAPESVRWWRISSGGRQPRGPRARHEAPSRARAHGRRGGGRQSAVALAREGGPILSCSTWGCRASTAGKPSAACAPTRGRRTRSWSP